MNKSIILALPTASLLGMAAPALAAPFGNGDADARDFAAFGILSTLQQRGVEATAVEEWGDYVRAYVTNDDGTQSMQLFEPVTLKQVKL